MGTLSGSAIYCIIFQAFSLILDPMIVDVGPGLCALEKFVLFEAVGAQKNPKDSGKMQKWFK